MAANVVFVRRATKTADILKCHNSVDKMSVAVIFDPQMFNRKRKDSIEAELCKIWKEKTSTNNRLYNATKFRLFDHCFVNGKLQFKLGITCYKDLCGTNLSRNVNRYMSDGAADYNDRYSYLSQTLGVGIILHTRDDHLVLIRRAAWTGEFGGCWDRPGGHPEPSAIRHPFLVAAEAVLLGSSETDMLSAGSGGCKVLLANRGENTMDELEHPSTSSQFPSKSLEELITDEVFDSIEAEVVGEIGVTSLASPPVLLGVSCNVEAGDRPSLEFRSSLDESSAVLRSVYDRSEHSEVDESTHLLLVPPADVALIKRAVHKTYKISINVRSSDGTVSPVTDTNATEFKSSEDPDHSLTCCPGVSPIEFIQQCTPALLAALLLDYYVS